MMINDHRLRYIFVWLHTAVYYLFKSIDLAIYKKDNSIKQKGY